MDDSVHRGIVIRQSSYGEAHRMLSVFTEDMGIVKAVRYGVRGKKTSNAAAFQVLSYGDFRLRPSGSGVMTAVSADIKDGFYPVSEDIAKLSLVSYLADITQWLLGEGNPDRRVLSLFLNIVYAAAYRGDSLEKLKCVYELKLMCACGYMPDISGCAECGAEPRYMRIGSGEFFCKEHRRRGDTELSEGAVRLMRYVVTCPDKRILAFETSEEICAEAGDAAERYVAAQCGREFRSLAYYKSMRDTFC